jgi:integrase
MTVKVREVPKGSGKWYVKVDWHQRRVSRQFPSQERARQVAEKLIDALDLYGMEALRMFQRPEPPPAARAIPTVREFGERWLREIESSSRSLSTRINYRIVLRKHISASALGGVRLDRITYQDLKEFTIGKTATYAKSTVNLMIATLHLLFTEATREGLVARNPVSRADLMQFLAGSRSGRRRRPDPFTLHELHAIEAIARESFPDWWPLICCLARTGMRISEAIALEWRHVDFRGRYLIVEQSLPQHRQLGGPKSEAGRRRVEMSDELAEVLRRLKTDRRKAWLAKGQAEIPRWVFCTSRGTPVYYWSFLKRIWRRLMEKAKVRPRTPHDLRHTFATLHLADGASPVWVKEQLGHSSIAMTVDVYKHWIPSSDRGEASRLDTQVVRKWEVSADETTDQDHGKGLE